MYAQFTMFLNPVLKSVENQCIKNMQNSRFYANILKSESSENGRSKQIERAVPCCESNHLRMIKENHILKISASLNL